MHKIIYKTLFLPVADFRHLLFKTYEQTQGQAYKFSIVTDGVLTFS